MHTSVILISGKQGSGKSSLQKQLVTYYNQTDHILPISINFADILYEMHDAVLNILHKYYPPRHFKKDGPLLQLLGTEWGRNTINSNIWVDALKNKMHNVIQNFKPIKKVDHNVFIIGDLRFKNEFNAFPDDSFHDAYTIRLEASEPIRKERCSMWRPDTSHISETNLDDYAEEFMFDLYIDTENHTLNESTSMVIKFLNLNKEVD